MDLFSFEIADRKIEVYRSRYAPVKSNMFTILTGNEAVVFDPNEDEDLLELFKEKEIEKVHILLTHGHYDHISGVMWLKEHTNATVYTKMVILSSTPTQAQLVVMAFTNCSVASRLQRLPQTFTKRFIRPVM